MRGCCNTTVGKREREAGLGVPQRGIEAVYSTAEFNSSSKALSSRIYTTTVLLHPTHRKQHVERKRTTDELKEWKVPLYQSVHTVWELEYKDSTPRPLPTIVNDTVREVDPFNAHLTDTGAPVVSDDNHFNTSISEPRTVIDTDHLLTWWNNSSNPWRR
jgi:hypothetical protein